MYKTGELEDIYLMAMLNGPVEMTAESILEASAWNWLRSNLS